MGTPRRFSQRQPQRTTQRPTPAASGTRLSQRGNSDAFTGCAAAEPLVSALLHKSCERAFLGVRLASMTPS